MLRLGDGVQRLAHEAADRFGAGRLIGLLGDPCVECRKLGGRHSNADGSGSNEGAATFSFIGY